MTRDEALLWLNNRLGKTVNVSIERDRGDVSAVVLDDESTLKHCQRRIATLRWPSLATT